MENLENKSSDLRDANRLSKRVVLFLELHDTPRLRAGHPDDVAADIIDHYATEMAVQARAHDLYEPVNEMLLRAIAANSQAKLALAVSGQSLEQLSKYAPHVVESLKHLHETGAVEWLGVPYNNSLSALVSNEVYREEVTRNNDLIYQYFGIRPKVLLATPFFEQSMVNLAAGMGFEALLVKPGVWPGRTVVRDAATEMVIIATNQNMTTAVSQHFGAGKATLTIDDFLSRLNAEPDDKVVIGFPYDVFQTHRDAGVLGFFEKFLRHGSKESQFIHPSETIHQYSEILQLPEYLVEDTTKWLGNEMQREALAVSRVLMHATQNRLDDNIRKTWLQLLSSDHFLHMSSTDAGLTSPYLSPYEAFANYKNLLDSLTRSLENAPVVENDKTVKAEFERQHPGTPTWALKEQYKYQEVTRSHI